MRIPARSTTGIVRTDGRRCLGALLAVIAALAVTLTAVGASPAARPAAGTTTGAGRTSVAAAAPADTVTVVFSSFRDGNSELYAVQSDGTGLRRLTNHNALDVFPSLSPDGTRVAFVSTRDGNSELYAMNLDGAGLVRLTNHKAIDAEPDWSPDGTRIAFTSSRTGGSDIYTARSSDGSGLARLTTDKAIETSPAWSPDGMQLAFVSLRSGLGDVYRIQSDGSAPTRLTSSIAPDLFPAWSPDGGKLAFASLRSGNSDIYTMKPDGSPATRLTQSAAIESEPAWSSDGGRLAISSNAPGRLSFDLYLLKADGTGATPLAPHAAFDGSPDWAQGAAGPPPPPPLESLTVVSTPDVSHRVTKTVGPLGGTLVTDAADGTHFELFVPPGALATQTTLTLAPTSVSGLAAVATSTQYGVEFGPSGLNLSVPATLTIMPPAGASIDDLFAASWRDGLPGIEVAVPYVVAGTLRISVPHFSGETTIRATQQSYDNMLTLALLTMPEFPASDLAQLRSLAGGLPGTGAADVAALVMGLHNSVVSPAIDHADEDIAHLRLAASRLRQFAGLFELFGSIGNVAVPNSSPPVTLDGVLDDAKTRFVTDATLFLKGYVSPACSANVNQLADWWVIPILAAGEIGAFIGDVPGLTFCASAAVETVAFPTGLVPSQRTVEGVLRGGVRAPVQTPDGEAIGDHKFFSQPTGFNLHAVGASFASGADLDQITGEDGALTFELDRGASELDRAPRVSIDGSATVAGFMVEVLNATQDTSGGRVEIHLTAGSPAETHVRFRSPPTAPLPVPGGPTELCVDLFNEENTLLAGVTTSWELSGSGSLSAATSVSNGSGVACVSYQHPTFFDNEQASATVTARATHGGAEGSSAVSLTLRPGLVVEIDPLGGDAFAGDVVDFDARVVDRGTGQVVSTDVAWAACCAGTITQDGTLTIPDNTPSTTIAVTVVAVDFPSVSATVSVNVVPKGSVRLIRTEVSGNASAGIYGTCHPTGNCDELGETDFVIWPFNTLSGGAGNSASAGGDCDPGLGGGSASAIASSTHAFDVTVADEKVTRISANGSATSFGTRTSFPGCFRGADASFVAGIRFEVIGGNVPFRLSLSASINDPTNCGGGQTRAGGSAILTNAAGNIVQGFQFSCGTDSRSLEIDAAVGLSPGIYTVGVGARATSNPGGGDGVNYAGSASLDITFDP